MTVERARARQLTGTDRGVDKFVESLEEATRSMRPATEELAKQELTTLRVSDQVSPDLVFRDPYFLDFLGLKDAYAEVGLQLRVANEEEGWILMTAQKAA